MLHLRVQERMRSQSSGAFPDKTGYAVGSVEGRCSIAYIEDTSKNFAFKCLGRMEMAEFVKHAGMQNRCSSTVNARNA